MSTLKFILGCVGAILAFIFGFPLLVLLMGWWIKQVLIYAGLVQ